MTEKLEAQNSSEFLQVQSEIIQVLQDVTRIGATDNSERELLENILKRFQKKEISAIEARKEIEDFLNSKQEYR